MQDGSSEQELQQPNMPARSNEAHDGSDTISHARSLVSSPTYANPVSPNTLHESPPTSLIRPQEQFSGHPYDNATNQLAHSFEPSQGQPTAHIGNMVNVHDMIQPLSSTHSMMPMQTFESSGGQPTASGGNMLDVHDMIQPLSSTHPMMPMQAFESSGGQPTASGGNMLDVHDMIQPLSSTMTSTQALEPPDGHTHDMFQSICFSVPAFRQPDMQVMVGNESAYAPNITETQNEQSQNDHYTQFKQFVPAA